MGNGLQEPDTSCSALASSSAVASGGNTRTWMAENLNAGGMVPGTASTANQSNDAVVEKYGDDDNAAHSGWDACAYNDGNSSGFSALPAGYRFYGGGFSDHDYSAYFWDISEYDASSVGYRRLSLGDANLNANDVNKAYGFSVRRLRDE